MNLKELSDVALLSLLLGKRKAKAVYEGSLLPLAFGNHMHDPQPVLAAAMEICSRMLLERVVQGPSLESPKLVRDYLRHYFFEKEHEAFVVIFLDAQNRVKEVDEMFRGTLTQTSVYPREVVKAALKYNAASVILAHNHPSGVAEPSRADELLTENLRRTLALVDVKVLDHLIVSAEGVTSFAERRLI